ncbi:hypothetical protein [Streptomyces albiaxialis]
MKWPQAAAKHRASIADSLATVTPVFVSSTRGMPDPKVLRRALYAWAFRVAVSPEGKLITDSNGEPMTRAEANSPPEHLASTLAWLAKHSLKVSEAAQPIHMRRAVTALSLKLNGEPATENTVKRKVMVLSNAMRYAIETGVITRHPLLGIDWTPREPDDEVDFRYVLGPRLARTLIQAVHDQGPRGKHLTAFFGCIYYAATRPGEAAALKDTDCVLPPESQPEEWWRVAPGGEPARGRS